MEYLLLKWIHILSSVVLVGTGFGSAFYLFMVNRSGNLQAMSVVCRNVVRADWWFTTPTILIQPISGYLMMNLLGYDWFESWISMTLILYVVAGLCWLPVVRIQIVMRDMLANSVQYQTPLPKRYWQLEKIWCVLGLPAFLAMTIIYWLMVARPDF